jgi:mannose-6-phosphate isomerase-like protein (cupin superfamily)
MPYVVGDCVERPWGRWEVLALGPNYVLKRVSVESGKRLSLQFHHHRAELWTIVGGQGEIELDGHCFGADLGDQIRIPRLARHRISNTGSQPLVLIEVQFGAMLDESDIERLEDDYGRAPVLIA